MLVLTSVQWRKSTLSAERTNCVEVAFADDCAVSRDSKDPDGPMLVVPPAAWTTFVDAIKHGGLARERP